MKSLCFVVLLTSAGFAQKITPPTNAAAEVQKIFARFNHTDTPGCAVGASMEGKTVLNTAYGMADLEHHIALTPDAVFEPGSVTKQFTAAAVLLLAQEGKLSLDDPVRKYFPELPDYGSPLTLRHLLNHTSGLRDWGSIAAIAGWPRTTRANSNTNVLDIAVHQKALNYTPGAEYSYTNTGFNLLAILVGRVSGESLADFTRERIFLPLGMTSTQWRDDFQRIVPNRAMAYEQSGGTIRQDMPFENAHGNGGLLTTVGDLLLWNRNFTEMKVGGAEFVKLQHQQGRLNDGRTIAYAAGLEVLSYKGVREVSHSGSTAGYRGWLARYPDQGLSVALLCNTSAAGPVQLGHAVADVYLNGVIAKPAVAPPVAPEKPGLYLSSRDHSLITVGEKGPASGVFESSGRLRVANEVDGDHYYDPVARANPSRTELEGMVGEYTSGEAEVSFTVTLETGGLMVHRRPGAVFPLTATYRDAFASDLGSVRFIRDAGGQVREMSISESRVWDLRFQRLK